MIRMFRSAILVLVLAHLAASAAFALPRNAGPVPAPAPGLAAAWEWIVAFFAPVSPAAKAPNGGIMTKAGSSMDPNGSPSFGMNYSRSTADAGSQMDPNGLK